MKTKCPWCGREVEVRKGRLMPHLQSAKVRCVGGGQTIQTVRQIEEAREKGASR